MATSFTSYRALYEVQSAMIHRRDTALHNTNSIPFIQDSRHIISYCYPQKRAGFLHTSVLQASSSIDFSVKRLSEWRSSGVSIRHPLTFPAHPFPSARQLRGT